MPKKVSKKASEKAKATKKVVVSKVAPKKGAVKKTAKKEVKIIKAAKPTKVVKASTKAIAISKPLNRAEIMRHLAETSQVQKKDVVAVIDSLMNLIEAHLKKRGPGEFTMLGLAKFRVVHKAATKARQGVNPFTGKPTVFAAKPARSVIKVKPLKRIKEMVK